MLALFLLCLYLALYVAQTLPLPLSLSLSLYLSIFSSRFLSFSWTTTHSLDLTHFISLSLSLYLTHSRTRSESHHILSLFYSLSSSLLSRPLTHSIRITSHMYLFYILSFSLFSRSIFAFVSFLFLSLSLSGPWYLRRSGAGPVEEIGPVLDTEG